MNDSMLQDKTTAFCVKSAPGAFEIIIEKVVLFFSFLHQSPQKLQTFLLILCHLQAQKEREALIGGAGNNKIDLDISNEYIKKNLGA